MGLAETSRLFQHALADHQSGRLAEARRGYLQILRVQPDHPDALHFLGLLAHQLGDSIEATRLMSRSIERNPSAAHYLANFGEVLRGRGQLVEAERCLRKSIELNPRSVHGHNNLGNVLRDSGEVRQAIECFRNALECDPACAVAHSNVLLCMHYLPQCPRAVIFEEHLRWAHLHGNTRWPPPSDSPTSPANHKIRIGYVSPDFRLHPVAFFIEPILIEHDAETVEVFCYSDALCPDQVTARLQSLAAHWRHTAWLSDPQLAHAIVRDQIDVLVDLAGHTAGNRMRLFATRLAPVQVTYLGYQDTTGLQSIDYRLVDALTEPGGSEPLFCTEKLVRLPNTFACYLPWSGCPDVSPPPSRRIGHITFASVAALAKISDDCLSLWGRVLEATPGSWLHVMGLPSAEPQFHRRFEARLERAGIPLNRIFLSSRRNFADYMAAHAQVDIILDAFPFTGHTTSCHALWMGVPVVTMVGDNFASRMGYSLMSNLELGNFVATTQDEFVSIATALASDAAQLSTLRESLRRRMRASPVLDAKRFTRSLEAMILEWRLGRS